MGFLAGLAAAAPAVGSVAGALMNKRSADKQLSFLKGQESRGYAWQKEMATTGIQKRVADAKAAGIHPLAALGASVSYGSPASVGTAPIADMSQMGQDIGRAVAATATNHERKMMDIQLDNAQLDNEMKRIEVTNARRSLTGQVGPGVPDQVQNMPAQVTSHASGRRNIEAGSVTSTGFARTPGGGLTPVPSRDVKERIEDQMIPELVWAAQNYMGPMLGSSKNKPPKSELPKGYSDWYWSYPDFAWKPSKNKSDHPMSKRNKKFRKSWGEGRFPGYKVKK